MTQWQYATIWYHNDVNWSDPTGERRWSAEITFPNVDRIDIRDDVRIEDVLNDLGKDGWELVSEGPGPGVGGRDFRMKRAAG